MNGEKPPDANEDYVNSAQNQESSEEEEQLKKVDPSAREKGFMDMSTMEMVILSAVIVLFCIISLTVCFVVRSCWQKEDQKL